jgi:putative two-component system response regulator
VAHTNNQRAGGTILIVDDNPEWTDMLSAYFSTKYRVNVANDATNAVQSALDEPPVAIIVDLTMPRIDGFGVIRRLKDTSLGKVPTVLFTGWNPAEVADCAESVGCSAVLSKSVSLAELDEAVSSAVRRAA